MRFAIAAAVILAAAVAGPACAGEVFGGGCAHAVNINIGAGIQEDGTDVELGYRTHSFKLWGLGRPSAYVLLSKNMAGDTNFGSIGVSWRHDFSRRVYGQIGVGGAMHDGYARFRDPDAPGISPQEAAYRREILRNKIVFGSRFLFQSELDLGVRITRRIAAEASYVHISNAGLSNINPGMDDLGMRLVYSLEPR